MKMILGCCNKQSLLTISNIPQPIVAKKNYLTLPAFLPSIACNTSMTGTQITLKQIQLKMAVLVWYSSKFGFTAPEAPVARNASTSPRILAHIC